MVRYVFSYSDVYCGNEKQLSEHLVVVHEYGRRVEAWQLDNDNFSEISTKVKRLIKAYKYKYILNWNTAVIQEVFKSIHSLIKTM